MIISFKYEGHVTYNVLEFKEICVNHTEYQQWTDQQVFDSF